MKVRFTRINILVYELLGVLAIHLGEIVIRFPCNHTNSLMFNYRDCIFALALFEITYSAIRREICLVFWLVFSLSFSFPIIEDKCNILIPYETWVGRGMPDWGQFTAVGVKEGDLL